MTSKNKRSLKNGYQYDSLISKADLKTLKLSNFINVDETVQSMKNIVQQRHKEVEKLAYHLKKNTIDETCEAIFDFVYSHIQYTKDRPGFEEIRTPARSWADRVHGVDCDCYSVFIGSILYNLGIPFAFRVTKYSADWQHVYPIAYDKTSTKGYRIIDCVVDDYDYEVPYTDKKDYKMSTLMLSGVDDYFTQDTTVAEDLAGLGKIKAKKKEEKKGLIKKNPSKAEARKESKEAKKESKKAAKANKKKANKKNTKKGVFSKVKAKGKEKRQIKKVAKKEKQAINPKKKGLFKKIRAKKKAKKEEKAKNKVVTTPTLNPIKDDFEAIETTAVTQDEFSTTTTEKETAIREDGWEKAEGGWLVSKDGSEGFNPGSWGSEGQSAGQEQGVEPQKNQGVEESQDNSQNVQSAIEKIRTGVQSFNKKADETQDNTPVVVEAEELEARAIAKENENDEKPEKEGLAKYAEQAITYTKENPAIVGGIAVGVPLAIWGISKLVGKSSSPSPRPSTRTPPKSVKPVNGLDGTKKKKKKKNKSKNETKTSKAHRKYARASFGGLK